MFQKRNWVVFLLPLATAQKRGKNRVFQNVSFSFVRRESKKDGIQSHGTTVWQRWKQRWKYSKKGQWLRYTLITAVPLWFYSSSLKISDGSLTAILTVITIVLVNNTQKCFLHAPVGDRQASVKLFRGADNFLGHYKTSKKKEETKAWRECHSLFV